MNWMENGIESVFPPEGFAAPSLERFKRIDRRETVVEVRFRNGLAARHTMPDAAFDLGEAKQQIRRMVGAFLDEVDSVAHEDRDW